MKHRFQAVVNTNAGHTEYLFYEL